MKPMKFLKRLAALVLCAVLALGALPVNLTPSASAASWYDPYMNTMKQWGVMTNGRGGDQITRAEMAAVLKRAFGFTRTGPMPFTDVKRNDWFYSDIATVYNEGIFKGTSAKKASPNSPVTREQVLTFIGRCLRYDETPGQVTEFTDGKKFNNWSAKYVQTALLNGIMSGSKGAFNPQNFATRGEVSKMMSLAMGNLVNSKGVTEMGGVFGNVTLNTRGATLRNTTIAGDLYLTGGVGLGDVVLDNVNVLGKIIVAGGGNSESSNASITLNNVTAQQLVVDPATGQFVSLRAIGNTTIPETLVKSPAYIQDDVRNNNLGLQNVILDAAKDTGFIIAGNMKNVINRTPGSTLTVGDTGPGSVTTITVGEEAEGSHVKLEVNANVDKINLDTPTDVTGNGDIGHLEVSTSGSSCDILPDKITVRPGSTTEVAGIPDVDSEVAKELSTRPNLLAGYPKVKNIAPTSADAYFSTNKAGTIYWALTDATYGPLDDDDVDRLIDPPGYGSGFKQHGSIDVGASKTEVMTTLAGLDRSGSYYISAVLVDGHDWRSPVKAQRFTTPDDTKPALANKDYPTIVDRTPTRTDANADLDFSQIADLQATVMANKSCDLYYVLLPAGSTQPTTNEFLSAAFANPYGYGKIPMLKNTLDAFNITDVDMDLDGIAETKGEVQESTTYDLYVWLTDANGEQSSSIVKKSVTTKDITPPNFFSDMIQTDTKATSVTLTNSVDEASTVYWAAYESGKSYPTDPNGSTPNTPAAWADFLRTDRAKMIVQNGVGAFKSGKLNAKANTDFKFNITGLAKETAYDVYYIAQDASGNFTDPVLMYTTHTLDSTAPTATQEFESYPEDSPSTPYAYSTINVVFSEEIRYRQPSSSTAAPYKETNLLKLYQNYQTERGSNPDSAETAEALRLYSNALKDMVVLYSGSNKAVERTASTPAGADWTVDYRNVQVYKEGSKLVVSFVNDPENPSRSALNLESGARYYFRLQNITDTSTSQNPLGTQNLPAFTTVSAQVYIGDYQDRALSLNAFEIDYDENGEPTGISDRPIYAYNDYQHKTDSDGNPDKSQTTEIPIDIAFTAEPRSTSTTADNVSWDMLFWFDTTVSFELFTRLEGSNGPWVQVGGPGAVLDILVPTGSTISGVSVMQKLSPPAGSTTPDYHDINEPYKLGGLHCGLNDTDHPVYEYALHFVSLNNNSDRSTFNQEIKGQVTFVTGSSQSLRSVTASRGQSEYDAIVSGKKTNVTDVTSPNAPEDLEVPPRLLTTTFEDGRAPQITSGPQFRPTPGGVTVSMRSDRPGTAYYILAPKTGSGDYALEPSNLTDNAIKVPVDKEIINTKIAADGSRPTMTTSLKEMWDRFPDEEDTITEDYLFMFPNSQAVVTPESSDLDVEGDQLITDHSPLNQASITEIGLTGLRPDCDYLMYIVTKGVSDVLSPVTVYQFHTDPVAKPILTTQATNANATIISDMDATVTYKLYPYDMTALPAVFTQRFRDAGVVDAEFAKYQNRRSTWKTDSNGQYVTLGSDNFTVLDAIIENIETNTLPRKPMGSLFDLCADEDLKQQVRQSIESTGGDTNLVGSDRNQSVKASSPLEVNCEKWKPLVDNVNYCLITCGYAGTTDNQSAYAFTAAYPISKPQEQIKVENISFNISPDEANPDDLNQTKTYSGYVTINFTQNLCLYQENGSALPTRTPLKAIGRGQNNTPTSGSQNVGDYIMISPPSYETGSNVAPQLFGGNSVSGVRFNVNQVNGTFTISFNALGNYFSGPRGERQQYGLDISVTIDKRTDAVKVTYTDSWKK